MQFTQKYTIIQLFEDVPDGTRFSSSSWPLHATLVDTFAVDCSAQALIDRLQQGSSTLQPTTSTATDDTYFGLEGEIQVTLLEKTPNLVKLHRALLAILEPSDLKLNDPQFAREDFLPHATVQKHSRLAKGQQVIFNAISVVDMFPNSDPYQRKILKTIKLA